MTLVRAETGEVVVMDRQEALDITAKIKGYVSAAWTMLRDAHERRAHTALGYATWEAYCREEFDISRAHAYRLLDLGQVVAELEEGEPMSPMGDISERQARELKKAPTPAAKAAAWDLANEATDGDPTAEDVGSAVEAIEASSGSDQSAHADAAGSGDDEPGEETQAPSSTPKVAPNPNLVLVEKYGKFIANYRSRAAAFDAELGDYVAAFFATGQGDRIERLIDDMATDLGRLRAYAKQHQGLRSIK